MSGKRVKPHNSFIQFLMDNHRNPAGELELLYTGKELAAVLGVSAQVISKYDEQGLDDLGKRIEFVKRCRIDIPLFLKWIASEITQRSA